jgi:hypothetical protein
MAEKVCGKCGEMVDEAKAFCPGCGHSFVEEKQRTTKSDFDLSANTVRLADSMYNQMLSDMGLSISKQPNREEPPVATIQPPVSEATAPVQTSVVQPSPRKPSILKWIVIGVAALVILLALLVVLAAVAIYFYSR